MSLGRAPPTSSVVVLVSKPSHADMRRPLTSLISTGEYISPGIDTLDDATVDDVAAKITALANAHQGHRFDAEHVKNSGGSYEISAIVVDANFAAVPLKVPLRRPWSKPCHMFFDDKDGLVGMIAATHTTSFEDAVGKDIGFFAAKFAGKDCILLGPEAISNHPKVIRALGLETWQDGNDNVAIVPLRIYGSEPLGKQSLRLGFGKFRFLFPDAPFDRSDYDEHMARKRRRELQAIMSPDAPSNAQKKKPRVENGAAQDGKTPAATPQITSSCIRLATTKTVAPAPSPPTAIPSMGLAVVTRTGVQNTLEAMVKTEYRAQGHAKYNAYYVAKNFLDILGESTTPHVFDEKLATLTAVPSSIALDMLGNVEICKSIASHVLPAPEIRDRVIAHVEAIRSAMTTM
jgi:hypothetical protein